MQKKINAFKDNVKGFAKEASLTLSWLKIKNSEGEYNNLRAAVGEVSRVLTHPSTAKMVVATTLSACVLSSVIAYKRAFWSDYSEDLKEGIEVLVEPGVQSEKYDLSFLAAKRELLEKFVTAHDGAPYTKYMVRGVVGANGVMLLGLISGFVNVRRRKDTEKDILSIEDKSSHDF